MRPVIQFLTRCQLDLHERVFVRIGVPSHVEVEDFLERADTVKHMIDLVNYIRTSGARHLDLFSSLTENLYIKTALNDIKDESDYTLETMSLLTQELQSLDNQLRHFREEQVNRVNMIFAIIGTIFLPLTFISGVFGMNFSNGGILVNLLER